jgi:nicotinamide-nucleotide amidase
MANSPDLPGDAERVAGWLHGRSLACAESCTAGLLAQAFASVEGSGDWFRGGIVAYQRHVKVGLLGVLPHQPLVSSPVAEQMARGTSRLLDATVTVATTGAAGPDPLDGAPPGTLVVGVLIEGVFSHHTFTFPADEPSGLVGRFAETALQTLALRLDPASSPGAPRNGSRSVAEMSAQE